MSSLISCAAFAQGNADSSTAIAPEIRQGLAEIGFAPPFQPSLEIYTPLVQGAPTEGVSVTKDISYGEDERHLLDVYQPENTDGAPVVVFIHGGGYTSGDRDVSAEFYGNIPTYFARNGYLGISATYRLAPDDPWPAGGQDVGAVVQWVKENAEQYGGDPDSTFLIGHSAGATHVATYAFDPRFQPPDGHGLGGIVLISGRFNVAFDLDDPALDGIRAYWGTDEAKYQSRSPIYWVENSSVPVMLVVAEMDQRNLVGTSGELFAALCDRDGGRCPRFIQLKGHNHLSEVMHFNTSDDLLGREIIDFIENGAEMRADWTAAR